MIPSEILLHCGRFCGFCVPSARQIVIEDVFDGNETLRDDLCVG